MPKLSVKDFRFDGPLGSHGARIEEAGSNHFAVTLGAAPNTDWSNNLQFEITGNAAGNTLRLDVDYPGGSQFPFNKYSHSWSHDGVHWQPIHWRTPESDLEKGKTLVFPVFREDRVFCGNQVPLPTETYEAFLQDWSQHPAATVSTLGESLEGRPIRRLTITNPGSPHPPSKRWVHYIATQHPGEFNAQWRMVGMVQWLLSDAGADCRDRTIFHFVFSMVPEGPSHGWYRTNTQGVDMNRTWRLEGASAAEQPHEAYVCQRDIENVMDSETPLTSYWAMHTWAGIVEPIIRTGPEFEGPLGTFKEFQEVIHRYDNTEGLIKPLRLGEGPGLPTSWGSCPHQHFGITNVLCEGSGCLYTQWSNRDSGASLVKAIADFWSGTR